MKSISILFTLATFFFISCKEVPCPIDRTPAIKIDDNLFGTWLLVHNDGRKEYYLSTEKSGYEYRISDITAGHRKIQMNCYTSVINNNKFCNLYGDDDTSSGFHLMRIIGMGDRADNITLATVYSSKLKKLSSPATVRDYIAANIDNPMIYKDTITLYKVVSSPR